MTTLSNRVNRSPGAARAVLLVTAGLACAVSSAADWQVNPRLSVGGTYDDNYLMDSDAQALSVSGADIEGQLDLRRLTQTGSVTLTPRVNASFYDESSEDSVDSYLRGVLQHNGQRYSTGLAINYANEATSRSERPGIDDPDLGEPDGGDSGIIVRNNKRELIGLQPSWRFDVTERNGMDVRARYSDVSFDKTSFGQTGFTAYGGSLGWVYKLSQTDSVTLRGDAGKYDPDSIVARDADSFGAEAEWDRQFSDVSKAYLRGGFRRTNQDELPTDVVDRKAVTSYVGGAGIEWSFVITKVLADLNMSVDPNSSGVLVKRDQVRLRFDRQFSQRLAGNFGVRYMRDKSVDDAITLGDRRYGVATAGIAWRQSRSISLTAEYNYTNQKFHNVGPDREADSNAARLAVVYEPHRQD